MTFNSICDCGKLNQQNRKIFLRNGKSFAGCAKLEKTETCSVTIDVK